MGDGAAKESEVEVRSGVCFPSYSWQMGELWNRVDKERKAKAKGERENKDDLFRERGMTGNRVIKQIVRNAYLE